jgi:cation diffusion facilitator family transporter
MSTERNPNPAAPAGSDDHDHHDDHDHPHDHEPHPGHGGHDHHDHDHQHSTLWATIVHAFSELTGAHSHDAADSVDKALESSERGIRALKVSFLGLMFTAVVQAGLVLATGSVALLADTIHNFSDALTAIPLFVAFKLGRRAANSRYTYGYRRAEDLAGLFIVLMILVSAVVAAWESVERLVNPREVRYVGIVFLAGVVGFLGNELVAMYRIKVGRAIGSAALVADGKHARVDGLTSLAVAAGAAGVWLGFERADPVVGILVSLAILAVLRTATRDIYRRLMDAVDPELVGKIEKVACSIAGVARVGRCQVRWMGHRLRVDMELAVDGSLSVAAGHQIAEDVRHTLLESIEHLDEVHVHVDPALDHPDPADRRKPVSR